jgi:hypothetical protein
MPYRSRRVSSGRKKSRGESDAEWERRWRELGYDEEEKKYYATPVEELYHRRYEQPSVSRLLHRWSLGEAPNAYMVVKLPNAGYLPAKFNR